MATPGDYSTFGTSAGFGTGAGNPGAGFAGPQSLGSSNSSFVMISPVAPGPPEDAAAPVRSYNEPQAQWLRLVSPTCNR